MKKEENIMEVWDIIDKNGNITGKTIIKGEPIPEGFYHLGADVWIINSENKFLIQKRSPKKRLQPNVWAMTGGSTLKGETALETIERETLEELGIKLDITNLKLLTSYKIGTVWINQYLIRQDIELQDIVMQEDEVSEVKWATYDEIEELLKNHQFMKDRWEFVRDIIREYVKNKS